MQPEMSNFMANGQWEKRHDSIVIYSHSASCSYNFTTVAYRFSVEVAQIKRFIVHTVRVTLVRYVYRPATCGKLQSKSLSFISPFNEKFQRKCYTGSSVPQ